MSEQDAEKLLEFLNGSSSFAGVTFQGMYTMNTANFIRMFQVFLDTGENHLDEFSEMKWVDWGSCNWDEEKEYYSAEKREKINKWLSGDSFWLFSSFVSDERMEEIKRDMILSEAHDIHQSTYKAKRQVASRHTSKKNIREAVFDKHGKKCIKCGSTKNIQIDHIIPVACGGENCLTNYQPLCKKCNSSKGSSVK